MKKYIVYKITNTVNNKIYIGVHLEDENKPNKYIGCGIYSNTSKCQTPFQYAFYLNIQIQKMAWNKHMPKKQNL